MRQFSKLRSPRGDLPGGFDDTGAGFDEPDGGALGGKIGATPLLPLLRGTAALLDLPELAISEFGELGWTQPGPVAVRDTVDHPRLRKELRVAASLS